MRAIAIILVMACVGCNTLRPLGKPTVEQFYITQTQTTLEYTVPTYNVYQCTKHGRICSVKEINGKPYCEACLWEKVVK